MPRVGGPRNTTRARETNETNETNATNNAGEAGEVGAADIDGVDSPISDADMRPEFRISVRGVAGQPTPAPNLKDDWHDAALSGEAKYLASVDVWNLVEAEMKTAVPAEEARLGRPMTDDELKAFRKDVDKPISEKHFKPAYAKHYADITKSAATKKKAIQTALTREGQRLSARARDPFTPVAMGDPAARAKEVLLWEDKDAMVLIDLFCPSPKALVVPKDQAMFPKDLPQAKLDHLAAISAKVSDAFSAVAGSQPANIWINPPQRLSLKQLHVHVMPKLPKWEQRRRPRGVPPDPALVAEQQKFYAALSKEIATQLSTPVSGNASPLATRLAASTDG
jgi:diadenosine tetraphosphate (Ap4A) HIT family hydrolase